MAKGDIWSVSTSSLFVRSEPNSKSPALGALHSGSTIIEIDRIEKDNNLWIKHNTGWCCAINNNSTYMELKNETKTSTFALNPNARRPIVGNDPDIVDFNQNSDPPKEEEEDDGYGYQPIEDDYYSNTTSIVENSDFIKIKNIAGVFGLPYQFLPNTDIRLDGSTKEVSNIGYEYAEKIIEKMPLIFIAPGKASFMTRFSKKNKKTAIEYMLNKQSSLNDVSLESLLDSNGRYYTFEYDHVKYYNFVNPMCRIAARYLNIQDIELHGEKLDTINWERFTKSGISSIGDFGTFTAVPFYMESQTSVDESFSNSTTQSMISSTVNSISDMGRELNFLLGYSQAGLGVEAIENDADIASNIENINDTINKLLGSGKNFFSSLKDHLVTVASGGKLIFPEIWSDSSFSRSYSCEFKFISPDPDTLSVYLNVLVPLFHLMGLVAPQSIAGNPNGYTNPFLIRAIYKGFFNVDMGIITDMSVTRGAECQWTKEGIPTSISVSISIKDLYQAMSITENDPTKMFKMNFDTVNNTALMDYIANLCGVNIYKPEIIRMIDMWLITNFKNNASDLFQTNIWGGIQQKVQNLIMGIFR